MREITSHKVKHDETLKLEVIDEPGQGGACHRYEITGFDTETNPAAIAGNGFKASFSRTVILFQNGPIQVHGVNGVTQEVLLAILIDRLESFQAGPYACTENAEALQALQTAQLALKSRTEKRLARGVEGTLAK